MTSRYRPNTIENLLKPESPVELYHILSIKKRKEYVKNLRNEIVNNIMEAERYSRKYPNAYKLNFIVNNEMGENNNMNIEEIAKNIIHMSNTIENQKKEIEEQRKQFDIQLKEQRKQIDIDMSKIQFYNNYQKKEIENQLKELKEYNNLQKDKLDKFIIKQ